MQLTATHEQRDLQAAVRRSMRSGQALEAVRAALDTGVTPFDEVQWQRRCEQIGIASLLVPEALGGAGAGISEAVLVGTELGAALSGEPFVATTSAIDTLLLGGLPSGASPFSDLLSADGGRCSDLVTRLAEGRAVAGVQMAPYRVGLEVEGDTLTGTLPHVIDAEGAHVLVAHVQGGAVVIDLAAVRSDNSEGTAHIEPLRGLDLSRRTARVRLDRVPCMFLPIPDAGLGRLEDRRGVLFAADSLGVMTAMLDSTVNYTKTRAAFGRKIGSFQGIKHQLADIFCTVERARAVVLAAAAALDADDASAHRLALLAQRMVLPAAVETTTECLRLLGGIGYTWEHDAHLQVRRAATNLALAAPQSEVERALGALLKI